MSKNSKLEAVLQSLREKDYSVHYQDWEEYCSFQVMRKDGASYARAVIYHDRKDCICLDSLSVSKLHQQEGIGTYLQEVREELGKALGCEQSYLSVDKGTWMEEWYKRRGYEYYQEDGEKAVFLRKFL